MMNQPQTHGGKRPGAGRPPRKDERKSLVVRVALTDHEHLQVLTLTPDQRREALLAPMREAEAWAAWEKERYAAWEKEARHKQELDKDHY